MATLRNPLDPMQIQGDPFQLDPMQPQGDPTQPPAPAKTPINFSPESGAPKPPLPTLDLGMHTNSEQDPQPIPNAPPPEPPPSPLPTPPAGPTPPSPPPTPPTAPATPAPPRENPFTSWAKPQISSAYKKYLGRDISDAEMTAYLGPNASEKSIAQVLEAVRTSPESAAWQQSHPAQWGHEAVATPTTPTTNPTTPGNPGPPLSGFDAGKWNDPNYHSAKYDIGHILAKYPSTPAGLQQAKAEIAASGLGSVTGKDIVTLKDGTIVDVGMGFSEGGGPNNWWWGVQSGPGGQVAPQSGGGGFPTPPASPLGSPDPISGQGSGGSGSQIDDILSKIMSGGLSSSTGQAGRKALEDFLNKGGNTNSRLESIREKMGMLERAQMNDARGELASRGLLSEGSTAQGPEMSTLGRIEANLTPQWTAAARDAVTAGDAQLIQAATVATGLDQQDIALMLSGANSASQREQMLATLAAKSLDQNMAWNEFLANYGLNRDQIMYAIQHGQVTSILPLIQNFFAGANTGAGGAA